MIIDHATSVTFYFGIHPCHSSLPLLDEVHVTLLLFIWYWRRLCAGWTLPIFEQSLGFYHFFVVLVVSNEEGAVLLFLHASVALVIRLAHE